MSKDDGSRGGSVDGWAIFSSSIAEGPVLGACKGDRNTASVQQLVVRSQTLCRLVFQMFESLQMGWSARVPVFSQATCRFRFTVCLKIIRGRSHYLEGDQRRVVAFPC
jgi:hypothetical protein